MKAWRHCWPMLMLASSVAIADVQTVSFVGCPIYRDTDQGRKSGCWLAEDPATGLRYDVTEGPTKPQVGKLSLFEGVVTNEPDTCGGIVLRPVRQAVLEGEACAISIIPAEHYPGRRFILPAEVLKPTWEPRELPPPPYVSREYHIVFDFGSDFLVYQYAELILEKVALYVKASKPEAVIVTGAAATKPIEVSGRTFSESAGVARARADVTALALKRLGVPAALLKIETELDPRALPNLGVPVPEVSKRRVTIRVQL